MLSVFRSASLISKVILITSLILAVAISFNAWWNGTLHEGSIERLTREKTKIISEFIERNVIRTMEKGRHFEIHNVLQTYSTYSGIWKINVFKTDGTIVATTNEAELNNNVPKDEFFLKETYFIREETDPRRERKQRPERVYHHITPILNRPECYQCHSQESKIVGVLTVASSLKEMDEIVSKVKVHSFILAIITITFLSTVLSLLFFTFVKKPIKRLTDTMKRVEEGDLTAHVTLEGKDEMGLLAHSLNAMIEKLSEARKEAEAYHQALVTRADRMASIGELASGLAHEIRNPLAGIQGAVQILADGFPKGDDRRQVSDEIQKQIHKLERLVKDLLNYAKPVPPNYVPTDIHELIEKVLAFFMVQGGKSNGLTVEKKFASAVPQMMIDPNSMEQAFLNIVLNARKAMPGGGTFTVLTRLRGQEKNGTREFEIVFQDTGIGIPEENLPKVFNPFFSTRSDGTGLGLSITKNILEQHGGSIAVESQVNVGTKFTITLPVQDKTA
jgi:signal transduction histidine kinase